MRHSSSSPLRMLDEGWGIVLLALNMPARALSAYPSGPNRSPSHDDNLLMSLRDAIVGVTPPRDVWSLDLFGIYDQCYLFPHSRQEGKESDRHSVMDKMALWVPRVAGLPENGANLRQFHRDCRSLWTEWQWDFLDADPDDIRERARTFCGPVDEGPHEFKVPNLWNYTHDYLVPLTWQPNADHESFRSRIRTLLNTDAPCIAALVFLRLDPRVMRACAGGPFACYETVFAAVDQYTQQAEETGTIPAQVAAAWLGLGTSQLVLLLTASTFREMTTIRRHIRNNSVVRFADLPSSDRARTTLAVVANSNTLLATPLPQTSAETPTIDTTGVGFTVLVRLRSGYHGSHIWDHLLQVAQNRFQLCLEPDSFGERQGMFNLAIHIPGGRPYVQVRGFLTYLGAFCPVVDDIATIVRYLHHPINQD